MELTASESPVAGRVAGAVLAAIRNEVGLTQQGLAEAMQVSLATVQGWESGRRPLINLPMARFGKLRRVLQLSTVTSARLMVLSEAMQADEILSEIGSEDPATHPLTLVVPTRLQTELLAWPMTGVPPRQLAGTKARLDVAKGERDQLAAVLRTVASRADRGVEGAMLRRQAQYLVAEHANSADWVAQMRAEDVRAARDIREWSPEWAVTRSRAISSAATGDLEPLSRFIEHGLGTEAAVKANLSYWAYWVGEIPEPWTSDADMLADDQTWSGELLLNSLLGGLENAPYRDLCAHALNALIPFRRGLDRPDLRQRVLAAIDRSTATHEFARDSLRKLDQLSYALRSTHA
ncbi:MULTISPECIES: helix-turn-helix transcriptional regulator [unclassified Saccharopolyspora]|uniref:helix-turn-helix domain-containing protein n=1 Tax=unclassified Saccharopolyspora TaxID=2646250 RepID=UPI001CD38CE3|nr:MULTISPECIES: helix-turn-helix transcriptional regulator [unclassified Saccharopolyspora]MCA1191363.1 helix-turn-helix domain-containing protein [Saccharopolyspora sp. 6V]MCA1225035.1 helix-turn-helix domain-containing protein [Saccharopolyspora sp. 6M]